MFPVNWMHNFPSVAKVVWYKALCYQLLFNKKMYDIEVMSMGVSRNSCCYGGPKGSISVFIHWISFEYKLKIDVQNCTIEGVWFKEVTSRILCQSTYTQYEMSTIFVVHLNYSTVEMILTL